MVYRLENSSMKRVITFGSFDVFHVGHLSILERAAELGDCLIVGVSTDELNRSKKGRNPVYHEEDRIRIIRALRCVDEVFYEESLELKPKYLEEYRADLLVMGEDWKGDFDHLSDICKVRYLPRTPSISTTAIIELIRQ